MIRDTVSGVPIVSTRVYWGLYWGPLFRETTICGGISNCSNIACSGSMNYECLC